MKFDSYESELLDAVENMEHFERIERYDEELIDAKVAARNYLTKSKNINIRIPEYDMLMLKRRSAEINIPYQTILSSLIHQYVTQKVKIALL